MSYTVVVVAWNGGQWIEGCLESILEQEGEPNVVVVDNNSSDDTVERARRVLSKSDAGRGLMEIMCLDENYGFPIGANRGMAAALAADPELAGILLLNQDARLEPGALAALSRFMEKNPKAGALGARILYPDRKTLQHAGGYLKRPRLLGLHFGHHEPADEKAFNEPREVEYVTGAAVMIRAECLRTLGLFKEYFSPGYYEDVELCDRLSRNGWSVFYVPEATVVHEESSSFTDRDQRLQLANRNRLIFAISHMLDSTAADDFVEAEVGYLLTQAHPDEVRAISFAALELLIRLPSIFDSKTDKSATEYGEGEIPRRVLVALRQACREALVPGMKQEVQDQV